MTYYYHHHRRHVGVVFLLQVFFSLVLFLLTQWWTPPLRLQVSDCSTFLMMCDVSSTAGFFVENLLNVFLILFKNVFKPLLKIPVPQMITGMIKNFMFHIC
jgi:hypothetical protein